VYKFDKQISKRSNSQIKIRNLFEFPHALAAWTSKAKLQMTSKTNKTLLKDRKRWRIERIDELDDGELGEQKCTQKIGILPGPTKKWRIKRIDESNDDELDEFYCTDIQAR